MNTSDEISSRRKRVGHLDELETRLSNLLHEVRFIADLISVVPPQLLDLDGRGLAALLDHMADDLKAERKVARKLVLE